MFTFTTEWIDWVRILLLLLFATLCGGVIGYQRETLERPAGFRTHILVCVGSAVYMLVSVMVGGDRFDPGRIAAQVASGMGFLGAGTIIKQGNIVHGLTTAASLWSVAGIGLAVGYGSGDTLMVALLSTVVVLLALATLRGIERGKAHGHQCTLTLSLPDPRAKVEAIRQLLSDQGIEVRSLTILDEGGIATGMAIEGRAVSRQATEQTAARLIAEMHVESINWYCEP
ncbi:MAG: MgtC/SapB family protein [Armatimonadota bacterium]